MFGNGNTAVLKSLNPPRFMILFTARLPGSPVAFQVADVIKELSATFIGIEIKVFDPDFILSMLDESYTEVARKVLALKNSNTPLDANLLKELLKIFKTLLTEPYDLLIIEGFVRSHRDVKTWKKFFGDTINCVFVIENLKADKAPYSVNHPVYRKLRRRCINSGSTYLSEEGDRGLLSYLKKNLDERLVTLQS